MKSIKTPLMKLPRQAPVMVLPNALLFPNSLLPLHIFEPRYRAMLEWSLENHRVFCIALVKRGLPDWNGPEDFHHIAGVGLVRACVGRDDGTSNLVLQGLARVKMTAFSEDHPFVLAEIRELHSKPAEPFETEPLTSKVLALCARLRASGAGVPEALDEQLAQIEDPEVLCDVVAHTFLRDPFRRQDVFEELRVGERLRLLVRHLTAEMQ